MTLRRSIACLLFAFFLAVRGAPPVSAAPSPAPATVAPLLEDAAAATKSAAASDDKAKALAVQKGAETDSYDVKKAAHVADQAALTAGYQQACPPGYPAERKAQCDQIYQTYVTNYNTSKTNFAQYVFQPSIDRWNALDAQQKTELANAEKQRAAAQRALSVLAKFFPGCAIGTTTAALEATVDCMHQAWDGGRTHGALDAVNSKSTPFFWNDANASVKKYHDQFNTYSKAQASDEWLLKTLQSQPAGPDRDMQMVTVKQRMSDRTNKMAFLKFQASEAAK